MATDQFNVEQTPELNQAVLEMIKKQIALKQQQDIATAQGMAGARGIAGSTYEANQIAAANRSATDAETNAAVQLAIQNAQNAREERLIKQGQQYSTSERLGSQEFTAGQNTQAQTFTAQQADLQRQFQELQLQKEQAFAAGQTEKAQEFQAKQDELNRQFAASQQSSSQAFTSGQNAKQRKVDIITGIATAGGNIAGIFCFSAGTLVDMEDGSKKAIKDIHLGDFVKGGCVISWRESLSTDLYNYLGVQVTGSHAVYDNNEWKRVWSTRKAEPIPGVYPVYSLVTTNHRIFVNGIEFADEAEHDNQFDYNLDESITELNRKELAGVK